MGNSRQHHFLAQCYLCNFAQPIFSKQLRVYRRDTQCWKPVAPRGIAWVPHLYQMITDAGESTDAFEKFLGREVESPAAPALKKAALGFPLSDAERAALALFLAITAARTPNMMATCLDKCLVDLTDEERDHVEKDVQYWTRSINRSPDISSCREFLKPALFAGILYWAASLRYRLLRWKWSFITTTRDLPFITSDWPVFAAISGSGRSLVVSFPISSEIALLVYEGGTLLEGRLALEDVRTMNRQTFAKASEFVVCHQESFPGDEVLTEWAR